MSRKKRKFESNIHPADKWMENMKFKDLKRECVLRGIPFEKVLSAGIPELSGYLRTHFYDKIDHSRLDKYDDWQEDLIRKAGESKGVDNSYLIQPSLRLGYIAEKDDEGNVTKRHRVKTIVAKKKVKRDRTEQGLFSGTKKAYTYQLQKEGKTRPEVVKMVLEQFPDASEKSIGIWFNKAKKLNTKKVQNVQG